MDILKVNLLLFGAQMIHHYLNGSKLKALARSYAGAVLNGGHRVAPALPKYDSFVSVAAFSIFAVCDM